MSKTLTVEGDIAAADTRTLLTTQGSVTAPSLVVPAGVSKIDKIVAAIASDEAADHSTTYILRLNGGAVKDGEQVIVIGASGFIDIETGANTAGADVRPLVLDDVDIAVNPSDTITIAVDQATGDNGTAHAVITLLFE